MSKLKVLIADDVDVMRKLLRSKLGKLDCEIVAEVGNGDEVIASINSERPEIVFLDINMPGKTGLQLLQEIKSEQPEIFVTIVSAYNTFDNIKKSMELGADGFIVKPFTSHKLQEMIDKYQDQIKRAS